MLVWRGATFCISLVCSKSRLLTWQSQEILYRLGHERHCILPPHYPARTCGKELSNWFCPSVCLSSEKFWNLNIDRVKWFSKQDPTLSSPDPTLSSPDPPSHLQTLPSHRDYWMPSWLCQVSSLNYWTSQYLQYTSIFMVYSASLASEPSEEVGHGWPLLVRSLTRVPFQALITFLAHD